MNCKKCGEDASSNPTIMQVRFASHDTRGSGLESSTSVAESIWLQFCSQECRDEWYESVSGN